jgi:hypothetical protein
MEAALLVLKEGKNSVFKFVVRIGDILSLN